MFYDSFIIKDDEPQDGEFYKKHDQLYAERYAEWQAKEDAKSPVIRLAESQARAYQAVNDIMQGCRNRPHHTLRIELERGRALAGLINSSNRIEEGVYKLMLDEIDPVEGPSRTMEDYKQEAVEKMAEAVDRAIMGRILG